MSDIIEKNAFAIADDALDQVAGGAGLREKMDERFRPLPGDAGLPVQPADEVMKRGGGIGIPVMGDEVMRCGGETPVSGNEVMKPGGSIGTPVAGDEVMGKKKLI